MYTRRLVLPQLLLASTALLLVAPGAAAAAFGAGQIAGVYNATSEGLPAADRTLGVQALASAVVRALASAPPPEAAEPWRSAVAEAAAALLPEGRLEALLAEPAIRSAAAWELRGVQCTVAGAGQQRSHQREQQPDLQPDLRWGDRADVREGDVGAAGRYYATSRREATDHAAAAELRTNDHDDPSFPRPHRPLSAKGESGSGSRPHNASQRPQLRARIDSSGDDDCEGDGDCLRDGELCLMGQCSRRSPDADALLAAFVRERKAGNGWEALQGWSNESDPCGPNTWTGVECTGGWVTSVVLQGYPSLRFELVGRELAKLELLSEFALSNTAMCGTIPTELGSLTQLHWLALFSNPSLSGTIPTELGSLTQLQELALHSNPSLSGTIPTELGSLTQLQELGLSSNPSLSGTIPTELGSLTQLQTLALFSNPSLSGTIPTELGSLTQLQTLSLYSNPSLSGTIPTELGSLTQLQTLYLYSNPSLSGTIPTELGSLTQLQELDLDSNPSLSGTIPTELGSLTQLQALYLYSNPSLSGTIPTELGSLTQLQEVYLQGNPSLSGTIPTELGSLTQLQALYLDSNPSLSGTIPTELGSLTQLQEVYLHSNPSLSGTVPALEQGMVLAVLDLHNCSLTALPTSLPESITHLYLNHNPINTQPANLSSLLDVLTGLHVLDVGFINSRVQLQYSAGGNGYGTRVSNPSPCHIAAPCAFILALYDDNDQPVNQGGLLRNLTLNLGDLHTPMIDNRDGTFVASIPHGWVRSVGSYTFEFVHGTEEFRPMMSGPRKLAVADDCVNSASTGEFGGACKGLRTVEFLPRECAPSSHTQPDDNGGATCVCLPGYSPDGNSSSDGPLSCHRDCRRSGDRVSIDGGSCECSGHTYNSSELGILLCSTAGWEAALGSASMVQAVAIRKQGGACVPCPSECVQCEDGQPSIREGWRLNTTTDASLRTQLLSATGGRPQFLFSCPYVSSDCPGIPLGALSTNRFVDKLSCPGNHSGALCATCMDGFSRRGSSNNACSRCSDLSSYIHTEYGLRPGWFAAVLCGVAMLVGGSLYLLWPKLMLLKAETKVNLRIMLGSAQVLSLMPTVLEMVFPPQARAAFAFTGLSVADIKNAMRTECWGWSWHDRWLASVVGIPLLATTLVAAYYLVQLVEVCRLDSESRREAHATARQASLKVLMFVVMFLYPRLSAEIFSALQCRALGPSSSCLEADYAVSCADSRYDRYNSAAHIMVVVVPIGFPLGLLASLMYQWRQSRALWADRDSEGDITMHRAAGVDDASEQQFARFHCLRLESSFGFAVEDFRAGCWWFEPIDLLRKLSLSGLLQFVHRGTAAQCFCGSAIAFASFGVQQRLQPYREPESNILKALVDAQLFLAFLVSFILRVLDVPELVALEPFGKETYGLLLVCSMALLICAALALTARQMARRQKFRARLLDVDIADISREMHGVSVGLMDGAVQQQAAAQPEGQSSGFNTEAATGIGELAQHHTATVVEGASRAASPDVTVQVQLEHERQPEPEGG